MYIVIKTVKGRRYRYAQWSWREGKKVRTKSRSLGPVGAAMRAVGDLIKANRTRSCGYDEELALKQHNDRCEREASKQQARLDKLYADFGLKLSDAHPIPIDAPVASVDGNNSTDAGKGAAGAEPGDSAGSPGQT